MVETDINTGNHHSPRDTAYFTDAYFHWPSELRNELTEAGFSDVELIALEGPFWNLPNLESIYNDQLQKEFMLSVMQAIQREQSLLGISAHFLSVGYK